MAKVKPTYLEKLRDPRWQKKRLELLEAAGWKCQAYECVNHKASPTLHVHHRVYLRNTNPWEYEDWAYMVLCDKCHKMEQSRMELCHVLLAKHRDLMLILMAINRLDQASQDMFIEDLVDVLTFSKVTGEVIDGNLFRALAKCLQASFSNGFDCAQKRERRENE